MEYLWAVQIETAAEAADTEVEETLYWYLTELGLPFVERELVGGRMQLRGYLAGETQAAVLEAWRTHVEQQMGGAIRIDWQPTAIQDWQAAWQKHWQPIPVGERLVIWPRWLANPPRDRLVIPLDPGMAFGTGEHATTRLCLRALEAEPQLGRFADIGCGCGVLTVAALLLGAESGWAVDIDPIATAATLANLELNRLSDRATVLTGSAGVLQGPVDGTVSNILAEVVIDLAPEYARLVRPGGWGIFSGLLVTQADRVSEALSKQGFQLGQRLEEGGWSCLTGHFTGKSAGS